MAWRLKAIKAKRKGRDFALLAFKAKNKSEPRRGPLLFFAFFFLIGNTVCLYFQLKRKMA